MTISELYLKYPDINLIHGISKIGPESKVPDDVKLVDQIQYSIKSSNRKLSTYSYKNSSKTDNNNYFSCVGLLIKEGEIIYANKEDTGYTQNNIPEQFDAENANWLEILNPEIYNEIIVKNVEVKGIVVHCYNEYNQVDILEASKILKLPIYFVNGSSLEIFTQE